MTAERVLRFSIPTRELLDRLASEPLPDGLDGAPAELCFFRDVFFDAGGDLERRGAAVRLRIKPDGARVLSVDVRERHGQQEQLRLHSIAEVQNVESRAIFAGPSEPARQLQAMIDPSRLEVQLELETMRRVRPATWKKGSVTQLSLVLDAVTLRHDDMNTEFYNLEIRFPEGELPGMEELVRLLEREFGARVTLSSRLARARELLARLEIRSLETAVRGARTVAVVVQREGKIALLEEDGELCVPTGSGAGEEACRSVLRDLLGRAQGQIRQLGTSPGLGSRPSVEVWLAQRVEEDSRRAVRPIVWMTLEEALARVGTPSIRDSSTLAALNSAARVGIPDSNLAGVEDVRSRSSREHPLRMVPRRDKLEHAPRRASAHRTRGTPVLPPEALLNMELSELSFQERVLALAEDEQTPLLERVRFVSILGSNLDEFFMTRVAGYHHQLASGSDKPTQDGLRPEVQLQAIGARAREIFARSYGFLWQRLAPALQEEGVELLFWDQLDPGDQAYLSDNYGAQLAGVLTPLAADPSHPFPHIRNLRPAVGVMIRVPEAETEHFAAIELPGDIPRFVPLPGGRRFVPLEEVIRASLPDLYQGLEVVEAHTFRVTRSANFSIDEENVSDLLQEVEDKVMRRPLGPVVRLEVQESMSPEMRALLLRELQFESAERISTLSEDDVYVVDRLVDLYGLREIANLPIEELHYPPMERGTPLAPRRAVWPQLREQDVLVHFPYDSCESTVERLLAEAVEDERVVSIKITLYRTNRSSRVVKLLRRARRAGKEVVALVELKASFDERRNIEWARALESVGIHVVYGPAHLKVHAKIMSVMRRENNKLRRYFYIGTGNLNAATAAAYTDLALLSTDTELGEELNDVFNGLTGYSVRTSFDHLLVAPFNMRERFLELIAREAEHARAGRGGAMRIKLNGLTDPEIIAALYAASQAGVRIEMIVRGVCCLRPGVPGLSENISIISILGRFLEHSRIYRFDNAGEPEYFIGSADWRPRNLSRRVEVVTPIRDTAHQEVLDQILDSNLANPEAWELQPDGAYLQRSAAGVASSRES